MSPDSFRTESPSWQSAVFGCVTSGQYLCPSIQSAIRFINSVAALLPTVTLAYGSTAKYLDSAADPLTKPARLANTLSVRRFSFQ